MFQDTMAAVVDGLMVKVADQKTCSGNKITVVGVGQVGMACAFSILTQVSIQICVLHMSFFNNVDKYDYTFFKNTEGNTAPTYFK